MPDQKPESAMPSDKQAARNRAQKYFSNTEQRDNQVRDEIARDRAAVVAKTSKLRALRLEKERADREAAAANPVSKRRKAAPGASQE